jgi:hypothetical protein
MITRATSPCGSMRQWRYRVRRRLEIDAFHGVAFPCGGARCCARCCARTIVLETQGGQQFPLLKCTVMVFFMH